MKTRIIHTKIWTDGFFLDLSSEEKLLLVYLLTNQYVNIIHLYECPTRIISFETGLSIVLIEKIKIKFEKAKKIYFYNNYIYLKNADKYERFTGEDNEIAKNKLYTQLSRDALDWYNKLLDTPVDTPPTPSIIHNSEYITHNKNGGKNKMNENIDPDDIPI